MKGKGMHQIHRLPGLGRTVLAVLTYPPLLKKSLRCIWIILTRFFLFQFRSALFPRIPVSLVEHSLDDRIPFNPGFIRIYLDFVAFWVRIAGFLSIGHGKQGKNMAVDFVMSITKLYTYAFQIYQKNLSTTNRPNYKKNLRFLLIHLVDPHLMCIPSLHVMLVVHSYTAFRHYLRNIEEENTNDLAEKVFRGAITITEAVLYVKQHSVNCIAAALYAMSRFDPALFNNTDAEIFVSGLFRTDKDIPAEYLPFYKGPLVHSGDATGLREYIIGLFRFFQEKESTDWTVPLLDFLKTLPIDIRKK